MCDCAGAQGPDLRRTLLGLTLCHNALLPVTILELIIFHFAVGWANYKAHFSSPSPYTAQAHIHIPKQTIMFSFVFSCILFYFVVCMYICLDLCF